MPALLGMAQSRFPALFSAFLNAQNQQHLGLIEAITYAMHNGGKRVRPALVWGACAAVSGQQTDADAAAIAVECIHGYSLVHDDLPCMDDDDLRRGLPTCHRQFNEALALLAGDALQALAFRSLSSSALPCEWRSRQVEVLASAAFAMVVGQQLDMDAEGQQLNLKALESIHRNKTGALIRSAVALGALAGQATSPQLAALDQFADCLGLAFQVQDDVLDVIGDTAILGKQAGADQRHEKSTYPALLGLSPAQALAQQLTEQAINALEPLGLSAQPLIELAHYLMARDH